MGQNNAYTHKKIDYGYKAAMYFYENPVRSCKASKYRTKYESMNEFQKRDSDLRRKAYYKSKTYELLEISLMNQDLKTFITLTFAENITNYDFALAKWQSFLKRFRKKVKKELKYICVWERQKRGAIHFHFLTNIDYIAFDDLDRTWGNGFVFINSVSKKKERKKVINYLLKYMTKEIMSKTDTRGMRFFFTSNNLKKPKISKYNSLIIPEDVIFENLESIIKDDVYHIRNHEGRVINQVQKVVYKKTMLK